MYRYVATAAIAACSIIGSGRVDASDLDGEVLFNTHCRNCHSAKAGDNRLGPSLHGIIGKPAGKVEGFTAYSGSLKDFAWDEATLDQFIASPTSVAPNTSMIYPPVDNPAHRKAIIEFIKSSSSR